MISKSRIATILFNKLKHEYNQTRSYGNVHKKEIVQLSKWFFTAIVAGTTIFYTRIYFKDEESYVIKEDAEHERFIRLSTREKRFLAFASVEYNGQIYMTPKDFLESILNINASRKPYRKVLSKKWVEEMQGMTPTKICVDKMFGQRNQNGIISYTEYIFLLSILSKPKYSYQTAFNMFDKDLSGKLSKTEFLLIEKVFAQVWKGRTGIEPKGCERTMKAQHYLDCSLEGINEEPPKTTLQIQFFGLNGENMLYYEDFEKFITCLEDEIFLYEFTELSQGSQYISEEDFARLLLKYTYRTDKELEDVIGQLNLSEEGIKFSEFRNFCLFLNNLEDFRISMRFYILAHYDIKKDDLLNAVYMSTGSHVSQHLMDTVFNIFDTNNDGVMCSSEYKHFIAVMKDRLYRGFRSYTQTGWIAFKTCVKQEAMSTSKFLVE